MYWYRLSILGWCLVALITVEEMTHHVNRCRLLQPVSQTPGCPVLQPVSQTPWVRNMCTSACLCTWLLHRCHECPHLALAILLHFLQYRTHPLRSAYHDYCMHQCTLLYIVQLAAGMPQARCSMLQREGHHPRCQGEPWKRWARWVQCARVHVLPECSTCCLGMDALCCAT